MIALLIACASPPEAPRGTEAPRPAAALPPVAPTPPPNHTMLTVDVVEVTGDTVRFVGPQGEQALPLAAGSLPDRKVAEHGATLQLDCETLPDGSKRVVKAMPHTGLGIWYGTVDSVGGDTIAVTSPIGTRAFSVNAWSDMPAGLAPGEYVGVKHYRMDDADAVLNTRRFPGEVVDVGIVEGVKPLAVRTLGGLHTHDVATDAKVGDYVAVGRTVEPRTPPLPFTGKLSSWDPSTHTFAMVDAWGATLGVVSFRLDTCDDACAAIKPGDLVEVAYDWEDGAPTIRTLQKKTLSPVFFGEIQSIDATKVTLVTLQRQPKELRMTPATKMPEPIRPGDFADVVWRGEPPEAVLVVKE